LGDSTVSGLLNFENCATVVGSTMFHSSLLHELRYIASPRYATISKYFC